MTAPREMPAARPAPTVPRGLVALALVVGIGAVSSSGVFIHFAAQSGVPLLAVAFWRVVGASVLLAGPGLRALRADRAVLARGRLLRLGALGALLGLHFACWLQAFAWTDFASNVLLLAFQPLFAALLAARVYGEPFTRARLLSLVLGALGLALIVYPHLSGRAAAGGTEIGASDDRPYLWGDLLSVLGCLAMALNTAIGKRLRSELRFAGFLLLHYAGAAAVLGAIALAAGVPLAVRDEAQLGWLVCMALVPTLLGHSALSFAVRYTRLYTVNVLILLEPALTLSLMALCAPGAAPLSAWHWLGGLCISLGVWWGLRRGPPAADDGARRAVAAAPTGAAPGAGS